MDKDTVKRTDEEALKLDGEFHHTFVPSTQTFNVCGVHTGHVYGSFRFESEATQKVTMLRASLKRTQFRVTIDIELAVSAMPDEVGKYFRRLMTSSIVGLPSTEDVEIGIEFATIVGIEPK